MKKNLKPAGWIPAENATNASVSNPIRHHFTEGAMVSRCTRALRPEVNQPVETADDNANNCARCGVLKHRE